MVAFTCAVGVVVTGGLAAVYGAAVGTSIGACAGGAVATGATTVAAATVVQSAVAGGIAGGAIAGAGAGVGVAGAGIGAVAGGTAAAGVGASTVAGALGLSGPVGWFICGTADNNDRRGITFDCWKPVVHETSMEPSNGMLLKELIGHPNIVCVNIQEDANTKDNLPDIFITNVWNETFHIEYLRIIKTNAVVCHARPLLA